MSERLCGSPAKRFGHSWPMPTLWVHGIQSVPHNEINGNFSRWNPNHGRNSPTDFSRAYTREATDGKHPWPTLTSTAVLLMFLYILVLMRRKCGWRF